MFQISNILKMADFCSAAQNKKLLELFEIWSYYTLFKRFFYADLIRTKVLKSTVKRLLVIVSLTLRQLILNAPRILKRLFKFNVIFCFDTSLCYFRKILTFFIKPLSSTTKKCKNKNLGFYLLSGIGDFKD